MASLGRPDVPRAARRLEVVWCTRDGQADRAVTLPADATVADLLFALGATAGAATIDGATVEACVPVAAAGVRRGSRVAPAAPPGSTPSAPRHAIVEVAVVAGLDSGRRIALAAGSWRVGRSSSCDVVLRAPSVSAEHAELHVAPDGSVSISDLGSTNGTWVDGQCVTSPHRIEPGAVVRLGAVLIGVRPASAEAARLGPARPDGTRALNRPPRPAPPPPAPRCVLPAASTPPATRPRLAWAALIAPLALGIGMAVLYDPRFAAFALFSPLMMLGTWVEDRRRARREEREGSRRLGTDIEELTAGLRTARETEQRRARCSGGDPAGAVAAACHSSTRLWERRPDHDDFGAVSVGFGTVDWSPPVVDSGSAAPEATECVTANSRLTEVPVVVDLDAGNVCGIAGPGNLTAAVATGLVVQLTASCGPADIRIAVLTDADGTTRWDWVKWLPHSASTQLPSGARLLARDAQEATALCEAIRESPVTTVVVVDGAWMLDGRDEHVRQLLQCANVSLVVCATEVASLPAACTTVVVGRGDQAEAQVTYRGGATIGDVLLACVDAVTAREAALALAGLEDPETAEVGAALPDAVSLLALLGEGSATADSMLLRWQSASAPAVPIGVGDAGPVILDLAEDGPHGLIAGTTGAGKSELLRCIVAGLAATTSPADLTFVLIDYKGGSAFDACAGLPHTVGMVTDLDENLGRRALRCLEAELRHRERVLRDAGAVDLDAYRAAAAANAAPRPLPSLPRLLVAVDEFATLAAEMPDFIDRLVSIAQRGRSLGVHLLLATQRPAGAVSDHIRANTNLRIALRVQDAADSSDVVGSADAAHISRRRPGRGYVRLGPGETIAFQAACVSGHTERSGDAVAARPFTGTAEPQPAQGPAEAGATDLQRIVEAAQEAFTRTGLAAPRRPWPEPLPLVLPATSVPAGTDGHEITLGLADDPDEQRRLPYTLDAGGQSLLLYGALSSGPTAALASIALAAGSTPDVQCYAIDAGNQALAALADLPHVGAVVAAGDRARQERLILFLTEEVGRRRAAVAGGSRPGGPPILLLLDNYAGFAAALDDLEGLAVLDQFSRIVADGPSLGITTVISADRVNALPPAAAATVTRRLLFRLPDRHDYAQFGVIPEWSGDLPANRAVDATSGRQVQLVQPPASLADAVAALGAPPRTVPPKPILVLPPFVALAEVIDAAWSSNEGWFLPLGLDDRAVAPAGWELGAGDHALVTGPARSGKSTVLTGAAQTVAKVRSDVRVVAVALRRSPLRESPYVDEVASSVAELDVLLRRVHDDARPTLLLIDDADGVDDPNGLLSSLLAARRDDMWCIAAGRADVLRTQYGHWSNEVRRSRLGLALRPNVDMDGDLWHTPLPRRRRNSLPPGCGYLVADGMAELLQAAHP